MGWKPAKNPEVQKKWERLVGEIRAGKRVMDVAAEHGVSPISLSRWNAYLRNGRKRSKRPKWRKPKEVAVLEVLVEPDQVAPGFIVDLSTGHRVHVDSRFDDGAFRRLVRGLSAP